MREVASAEVGRWPAGRTLPLHPSMQSITLEVILRAVFGVDDRHRRDRLRALLGRLLAMPKRKISPRVRTYKSSLAATSMLSSSVGTAAIARGVFVLTSYTETPRPSAAKRSGARSASRRMMPRSPHTPESARASGATTNIRRNVSRLNSTASNCNQQACDSKRSTPNAFAT